MNNELAPCSRCGSMNITHTCVIGIHETRIMCFCRDCDAGGPGAPSQEQARAAWNEKQKEADDGHTG